MVHLSVPIRTLACGRQNFSIKAMLRSNDTCSYLHPIRNYLPKLFEKNKKACIGIGKFPITSSQELQVGQFLIISGELQVGKFSCSPKEDRHL